MQTTAPNLNDKKTKLVEIVRRWGGAASDAVLDAPCKIFSVPDIPGVIGYRPEHGCALVFGDPVCGPEDLPRLTHAFHDYCEANDLEVIYITASAKFAKWAVPNVCPVSIECASELFIDPHADPRAREGVHAQLVRRKVRHALSEGVVVNEYLVNDPKLEEAIERVGASWLESRRGPQVYISHVRLFDDRFGKRWFYARKDQKVVGVLLLNELQARQGWLFNHLMITSDAPNGTPEILVISALDKLRDEQTHYVTFGAVPAKELGQIVGLNRCYAWIARGLYKAARKAYNLNGRMTFWGKFHPSSEPAYLLLSKPHIGLREIKGLKSALNATI